MAKKVRKGKTIVNETNKKDDSYVNLYTFGVAPGEYRMTNHLATDDTNERNK